MKAFNNGLAAMGEIICGSYLGLFPLVDAVHKTKEGNFERLQHFGHSVPNIFVNRVVVGISVVLIWKSLPESSYVR